MNQHPIRVKKHLAVIVSLAILISPITFSSADNFLAPPLGQGLPKRRNMKPQHPRKTKGARFGDIDIGKIACQMGLLPPTGDGTEEWEPYGLQKAKIFADRVLNRFCDKSNGKLILTTAINPPKVKGIRGVGKSTMNIGLTEGLALLGKKACSTLRQPSPGPVFGLKSGGTGAGLATAVPEDDINVGFTGDIDAVRLANNLLVTAIVNSLYHVASDGKSVNALHIDPSTIRIPYAEDVNAVDLREAVIGIDAQINDRNLNIMRKTQWINTVATQIMATLCMSRDMYDLRERLDRIIVAKTLPEHGSQPVTVKDLNVGGALTWVLRKAIEPNLVQTQEGQPVIIHGAPFANIAHGCSSERSIEVALKLFDYVVTEAGFGADLGAEKFFDILCRKMGINPDLVVLAVTVPALMGHGRYGKETADDFKKMDFMEKKERIERGFENLDKHIHNVRNIFGMPVLVVVNKFKDDTQKEFDVILDHCRSFNDPGLRAVVCDAVARGGEGAAEFAQTALEMMETQKTHLTFAYELDDPIDVKIQKIAQKVYGADGVEFSEEALRDLTELSQNSEYCAMPVCIAKTPNSLSGDEKLLGNPKKWNLKVERVEESRGAGFLVVKAGDIKFMPAQPWKTESLMTSAKFTGFGL